MLHVRSTAQRAQRWRVVRCRQQAWHQTPGCLPLRFLRPCCSKGCKAGCTQGKFAGLGGHAPGACKRRRPPPPHREGTAAAACRTCPAQRAKHRSSASRQERGRREWSAPLAAPARPDIAFNAESGTPQRDWRDSKLWSAPHSLADGRCALSAQQNGASAATQLEAVERDWAVGGSPHTKKEGRCGLGAQRREGREGDPRSWRLRTRYSDHQTI